MVDKNNSAAAGAGLFIMLGLLGAGWFLGSALKDMRAVRYVSVRGLAEQEVKADLAIWPLRLRAVGDDLGATQASLEAQKKKTADFLIARGFSAEEINPLSVRVTDRQAQEYVSDNARNLPRYFLQTGMTLRSGKVDLVASVSQSIGDLVKAGVALGDDNSGACGGPSFLFTGLNAIKPAMLADATKNAREAAGQFAKDAGAAVGSIRNASQGYFSISGRDRVGEGGEGGGGCEDTATLHKKVRLVTTIDYYLE